MSNKENPRLVSLTLEQFEQVFKQLKINPIFDKEFIYEAYLEATKNAQEIMDQNLFGRFIPLNPVVLILYIVHEYAFLFDLCKENQQDVALIKESKEKIVNTSLDKYFSIEHLSFHNESAVSKYTPQISTIAVFLNFLLGALKKYSKHSPTSTLKFDILQKSFLMMKAMLDLMVNGFPTEAFSTWRTLHESECIIKILVENDEEVSKAYLKHMNYALAFRGAILDKEKVDQIFVEIKKEMAEHDLKSKDMKKFIEYGWLYSVKKIKEIENFKLNFRDGVEKVASLSKYSKTYEVASEIAHSSPILIYSRPNYFFHFTLINIYETFFRLENIFKIFYSKVGNENENKYYDIMRQEYLKQLLALHNKEKRIFASFSSKKNEANN